jgi:hypothetical protein
LSFLSSLETHNIFPHDSISRRVTPVINDDDNAVMSSDEVSSWGDESLQSSVIPTGPGSGPPDFVPRLEGDLVSKYDVKPSIMRDTPPAHLRYRRQREKDGGPS